MTRKEYFKIEEEHGNAIADYNSNSAHVVLGVGGSTRNFVFDVHSLDNVIAVLTNLQKELKK